jgi:protein TonB
MLQPSPPAATPFAERFRIGAGRRTLALAAAVAIEGLLLLLLLSLGTERTPGKADSRTTVVAIEAAEIPEASPEPSPEPAQRAQERPQPERPAPAQAQPSRPSAAPSAQPNPAPTRQAPAPAAERSPLIDVPWKLAPSGPSAPARPRGQAYGPANPGGSGSLLDSEIVGTAPNGEPLYAAAWYRRPTQDQLRGYLSTASGPGWGLIACRTVAEYRVEDCVALDEYPAGSQINRAILAAAWEFRVRPPRRGGRLLVGSWVRIRIDYGIERRR